MALRFDFNNLLSFNVGEQGVSQEEIVAFVPDMQKAHSHLTRALSTQENRVNLDMEWTQLPLQDEENIKYIQAVGKEIARRYENVLFLGIGGSYLGLKAAQDALCPPYYNEFKKLRKRCPRVYFEGNNLDPDTLHVLLSSLNPKRTFVVVISKSGETTETKAAFMVVEAWLKKAVGRRYGRQIFAITDPAAGSLRKRVTAEQHHDKLSFRSLPLLKGVGGRYSEFNMGLLHLAISGISIKEALGGAREMLEHCSKADPLKNPAYLYASLHTLLYLKKGKTISILMPFSQGLKSTADWYVQLLAESLGKKYHRKVEKEGDGTEKWSSDKTSLFSLGRTPVSASGTNDLHSIQQNNVEGENNKAITFIGVEKFKTEIKVPGDNDVLAHKSFSELMSLAQEATEWALAKQGRPNCTIIMPEVSAHNWGALLFFFEMATAFEGELLNVNAFDQPGVESYKKYMYYKLGKPDLPPDIAEAIKNKPLVKNPEFIL